MKEHRFRIEYDDTMSVYNLISELDNILKGYGIHLEIENKEHDGFDICVVQIEGRESSELKDYYQELQDKLKFNKTSDLDFTKIGEVAEKIKGEVEKLVEVVKNKEV